MLIQGGELDFCEKNTLEGGGVGEGAVPDCALGGRLCMRVVYVYFGFAHSSWSSVGLIHVQ